ncbi:MULTISPECIES: carbohydrate ABC transporter permease [unclassified Meiothermus]|uniref:carbohydrate ABC transporter permease n=1 Tax=unclassified Meiothermus TaxID=370471 RepID=UPI000D7C2FD9|nr:MULTISPECIES: carbohydrate ABC transporter permease [unclassified Meiothermus]PZA08570.1 carbohydrate ABC transporter permease [Meiothermus sp. Pnk-1]RYM40813.1 carbohydrate ABC transporter permease [Meiothermus sp. PNK-Is4]
MNASQPLPQTRKRRPWGEWILSYAGLTLLALLVLMPVLVLLSASLKPPGEVFEYPPRLIPREFSLENYRGALEKAPLARYLFNTLLVAVGVTLGQLLTSALAAFGFARLNFPAKRALFLGVLATYMVPWELTLIPNYLTISHLRLLDSYWGLVLPFLAGAFGIFLLRQNFLQIPEEYFDAAKIDGATPLQQLRFVAAPLARPALASLALLTFLNTWNQYLWPLVVTSSPTWRTAQIGLRFFLVDQEGSNYGFVAAGAILVLAPTLIAFIVLERAFVRGISVGGVKG